MEQRQLDGNGHLIRTGMPGHVIVELNNQLSGRSEWLAKWMDGGRWRRVGFFAELDLAG